MPAANRVPAAPVDEPRNGVLAGVVAYGMWGLFPLYFHQLDGVSAIEILAHRVLWSLVVTAALSAITRRRGTRSSPRPSPALLRRLAAAAALIALNWLVYIWAVNHGHVVEAALGYFINPLVTVGLGVGALGERLRRTQWAAVAVAGMAVVVLTFAYGRPPLVSLVLAMSFAGYGYLKKSVPLGATDSLLGETVLLAPFALGTAVVLEVNGTATFIHAGGSVTGLLLLAGPVTTVPLVLFAAAARRIPLSLLGLLQYLTPVGQFLCGVLVLGERLSTERWIGFGLVWIALAILSADALHHRPERADRTSPLHLGGAR